MKRVGFMTLALWGAAIGFPPEGRATCLTPPGDVSGNGQVDVVDVQCSLLIALWELVGGEASLPVCSPGGPDASDADCSGDVTVTDVMMVVGLVLGSPLAPLIDGDGNGCADACELGCCGAHSDPGCPNDACVLCVCKTDAFCCDVSWDSLCSEAHSLPCQSVCQCVQEQDKSCCVAHGTNKCSVQACYICVNYPDPFCFEVMWDMACVATASGRCKKECGCEMKGPCCEPNIGVGCAEPACEACVCAADKACCGFRWDESCVATAANTCASACGCTIPKNSESCCLASPFPGCGNPDCQTCVCAKDPLCCQVAWDGVCAGPLADACQGVCDCWQPTGEGNCCVPHTTKGCEAPACAECVCAADSWCCRSAWDKTCTAFAEEKCKAVCGCG